MPWEYGDDDSWDERRAAAKQREQFLLGALPHYLKEMQPLLDTPLTLVIEERQGNYRYTTTD